MNRLIASAFNFLVILIVLPAVAHANSSEIDIGRELAELNCASCHNIERTGDSPFDAAPPFRTIPEKYKPSELEEAFVEGIVVGHPAMPEWQMTGEQAAALTAFIADLAR
jgi:mono/diheme cytochrome c family protein